MVKVAVIGAGPAGLMAADLISHAGLAVEVYDAMPSAGRKFLMAGRGGLNITHGEPLTKFLTRYGDQRSALEPMIRAFGPEDIRAWCRTLGVETFVGTSQRVFPTEMKAAPLLRAWLRRLRSQGVMFHMRHRWVGWDGAALSFETPHGQTRIDADATVLTVGGGSWSKLGSDGAWVPVLRATGISVIDLKPSNCGFDVSWSNHFKERFAGAPVKPVNASAGGETPRRGEFVITANGVEGGLIYTLSATLRDNIAVDDKATLTLDLLPAKDPAFVTAALTRPRGKASMATHLRKRLGIEGVKAGLIREVLSLEQMDDPGQLAAAVKALPLPLTAVRPLDEAISSAGGVSFGAVTDTLMLKSHPGLFCAGEMLDWEAPTGGYLLTACLATGRVAGLGVLSWLKTPRKAPCVTPREDPA